MPGSFQNPVGGPPDPYEKYRVEEIQKDRDAREKSESHPRRSLMAAFVAYLFKKFLDLFVKDREAEPLTFEKTDVEEHLGSLKTAFESLKTEDRSQDVLFLNQISHLWLLLLDDAMQFRRGTPFALQINAFIKAIQHYPEEAEHPLGYYLSEYAGQKWLPFPYMDMIRTLWADHQSSPDKSRLAEWCDALDAMLATFRSD